MKKVILTLIAVCLCVMASEAKTKVQYKGNFTFGSSFGTATTDFGGVKRTSDKAIFTPEFETVHGALFGKNFFLGMGTGFKYAYCADTYFDISAGFIPVFGELKCYIPVTRFVAPYIMADLGYGFCVFHNQKELFNTLGGFAAKAGIGIEIDTLVIALGYSYQGIDNTPKSPLLNGYTTGTNSFFLKLGFAF